MLALADQFTVICPDTPGFGLSSALPIANPTLSDYASALATLLDLLGIERTLVYGVHTGAMIALEFARRYPGRCQLAALNGLVVLTAAERKEFLARYTESPELSEDGAHMTWAWRRIRDQLRYFPWYDDSPSAHLGLAMPPPAELQPAVQALLETRSAGAAGYRAAFNYPTQELIGQVAAPLAIVNFQLDPIAHHPERLTAFPPNAQRYIGKDPNAVLEHVSSLFTDAAKGLPHYVADALPVDAARECDSADQAELRFINDATGALGVWGFRPQGAATYLLLHGIGASGFACRALAESLSGYAGVLAPDLPGHGTSRATRLEDYRAEVLVPLVIKALDQLLSRDRDSSLHVVGFGEAAGLAAALAAEWPAGADLSLINPICPEDPTARAAVAATWPDLTPQPEGEHLSAAWRHAELREDGATLAARQERCIGWLQAWPEFRRLGTDLLNYDVSGLLSQRSAPTMVACADSFPPNRTWVGDLVDKGRPLNWPREPEAQAALLLSAVAEH